MQIFNDWKEQITGLLQSFPKNLQTIISNPLSIVTLIGCIILLIVLVKAKKIKFTPQLIARIGIALALATILKILRIYHFPQGGSVTLGSMIPIFLIAFMYGPRVGSLTGFLYGIITFIMDPYILHPIQVLFDYPLPFMALGIAGLFKEKRLLGILVALFLRFGCHFISGIAFFASFAPEGMSPALYSLTINGCVVGSEAIICLIIISILPIERILHITSNNTLVSNNNLT